MIVHYLNKNNSIYFRKRYLAIKWSILGKIITMGMSSFLVNFCSCIIVIILNKSLIKYGGVLAVGAYGIVNSIVGLIVMLVFGFNLGMQPIAGYNYGASQNHRLKEVFLLTMKWTIIVGTIGAILALSIPQFILRAFTSDEILVNIGVPAMRYLNVMMPLIAFTITNSQFFQSIDKPWIAIVTSLSRQVLFLIPLMFLIPLVVIKLGGEGLTGVWITCTICDVLGALLAAILMISQIKVFRQGYIPTARKQYKEAGPKK